jgi:ABC-type dipeptide/oligopeptide/nickel transport system permease subunit
VQDGSNRFGLLSAVGILGERNSQMLSEFARSTQAQVGAILSLAFITIAVFAPLLAPYAAHVSDFDAILQGPSATYPLGTDELGRDQLSRLILATRVSMQAGVMATGVAIAIAIPLGLLAGYHGGWLDRAIMRLVDVALAFPFLVLAVLMAAVFGPSLWNATFAIGLSQVPYVVRILRAETLSIAQEEYVASARVSGVPTTTILRRHVLPNLMNTLIVQATIIIPSAIIAEAVLSFLGLGVQPPTPSWGVMLSSSQGLITEAPWLVWAPGLAIAAATISFNLLGDALRDVLDPKIVGRR